MDYEDVEPVYSKEDFFLENTPNPTGINEEKVVYLKQYKTLKDLFDGTTEGKHLKDLIWVNYANLNYDSVKVSNIKMEERKTARGFYKTICLKV